MYSEQLAVLLLVAANSLSSQAPLHRTPEARLPRGGGEEVSVNLKLDPRFQPWRSPTLRRAAARKALERDAFFASND